MVSFKYLDTDPPPVLLKMLAHDVLRMKQADTQFVEAINTKKTQDNYCILFSIQSCSTASKDKQLMYGLDINPDHDAFSGRLLVERRVLYRYGLACMIKIPSLAATQNSTDSRVCYLLYTLLCEFPYLTN